MSEGYLDPVNIQAVREGVARMDNLAGELDSDFEWQRSGYLCLIKTNRCGMNGPAGHRY